MGERFGTTLEFDDVSYPDDHAKSGADPEGSEVNQAYLSYKVGKTTVKYGRQRILLDNQRFVGGVGFRQNEQTYDGFTVQSKDLADTTLFAAYIRNVNRIFGDDSPIGDHEQGSTYLLNAKYEGLSFGKFTGYHYSIDNENALHYSTKTTGLRFQGKINDSYSYNLEYARQTDSGDNPNDYSAAYTLAEFKAKFSPVTITVGNETLGADGDSGQFITPLATLHKFQGWSDQFLGGGTGNVAGGISDTYIKAVTKVAGFKFGAFYNMLSADDSEVAGVSDYGTEIGLLAAKKFGPVGLSVKYAQFKEDETDDVLSKLWLTTEAKF